MTKLSNVDSILNIERTVLLIVMKINNLSCYFKINKYIAESSFGYK